MNRYCHERHSSVVMMITVEIFWGHPTWSSKSFSSRQVLWSRHKGYNDFGMFKKVNFRVALIKNNYNVCLNVKIKWCPIFLIILVDVLQKMLKFVIKNLFLHWWLYLNSIIEETLYICTWNFYQTIIISTYNIYVVNEFLHPQI